MCWCLLLKALELVCRYRFMFLEGDSPFVYESIEVTPNEKLHDRAASVMRELDWLTRDARQAKLDDSIVWAQMLGGFELVRKMTVVIFSIVVLFTTLARTKIRIRIRSTRQ